ncbi:TonB-dependent receptor domain-containing protein [uncultured Tenacibaculum sp.]|uniref:TonB-dependent receptor n=1 Tax=uncultured Tenacibaculum sp. TaxID=174713 RepID=UPI002638CCF6|nr:TonB-dependent receptor [uncultured Tenacibaculum sp.]
MLYRNTYRQFSHVLVFLFINILHLFSQEPNYIPLADALENISDKHDVYFTYNPLIIKTDKVDVTPFQNLSLKQSIALLKKVTSYKIEYLGNKYYVIFKPDKNYAYKDSTTRFKDDSEKNIDSIKRISLKKRTIVRGIVLDEYYNPIHKANVIESNTKNGTITRRDGSFELKLLKNNPLNISHIGFVNEMIFPNQNYIQVVLKSGVQLDEVFIVGSRNSKRQKIDSPVSTEVIDVKSIIKKSELLEVNQLIQTEIPSFNATKQSGSDGADHIIPATYRGLGPDQTLVLINGKRRHQTSLINLYGTRGRGNSGTDLNTIPTSAIKRIEVLKDGASAQYGSDAIAGVINIVLNDNPNETNINSTFGFYNANNNKNTTKKGVDGLTFKTEVNYGAPIKKNGFVNLSAEFLTKGHTFRQGTVIRENYGDAAVTSSSIFFNAEIPVSNSIKAYTNGGYNFKNTDAYAFTRPFDSERNVQAIFPDGFNPLITTNISDKSFTLGFKGKINGWNVDFSNSYGNNYFHYFIKETLNATLLESSPNEFDAGGHSLNQNTTNIDLTRQFSGVLEGLHIALGLENKIENYKIFAGEPFSYESYDLNGNIITNNTPTNLIPTFNGIIRPGGSQGFPGYAPINEVDRTRTSFSFYVDGEIDITKKWILATAIRYENYSDFGNSFNTKIASNLKITPKSNLRFSFSTGFRAPSLAQIYYNLKFTNYIDNVPTESFLIANNNPITRQFGIQKLKEEKAQNYSLGYHHRFSNNLSFSVDAYHIFIKDRIILSGNFDASLLNTDAENVQFFANGVSTNTFGIDFKLNWLKKWGNSRLSFNLSGNVNDMKITRINYENLNPETFFGIREQFFLKASAPDYKIILNSIFTTGKFSISNTLTQFSSLQLIDWQINNPISEYNNSSEERFKAAIDNYDAKLTLDSHLSYNFNKNFSFQIGANNLFNTYPTVQGENTDSGGLWDAVQMGTNGAFYYSKILAKF